MIAIGCVLLGFLISFVIIIVLSVIVIIGALLLLLPKPPVIQSLTGKHILITGGSKGIGRALAVEAARRGAHVTIVARNLTQLNEARQELEQLVISSNQKITTIAADLTKSFDEIRQRFDVELSNSPKVDILVNNAGGSVDAMFDELPVETFESQMKLNYLSSVYVTRYFVEQMKQHAPKTSEGCRIVFVSSQAGQLGVFGYTAYSPTKYAIRGFAEALQMELKPFNIWITISYPPNTQTEGFAEEIKTMPKETQLISETSGLFQPSEVANTILKDVCRGRYASYIGMDGWMLSTLSCGMAPETGLMNGFQQVVLNGLFRFISIFYMNKFDSIVKRCADERRRGTTAVG